MDEVEALPSAAKGNAMMNKTIIQQAFKSSGKGTTSGSERLQQDAGAAAHREARKEANPVDHSPSKRSMPRGWPPAPGRRSEGPRRREPEKPELDGAPQRKARQDVAEGVPPEIVDGPVGSREPAGVDGEGPQSTSMSDVARAKAKKADVPS